MEVGKSHDVLGDVNPEAVELFEQDVGSVGRGHEHDPGSGGELRGTNDLRQPVDELEENESGGLGDIFSAEPR